jgi:hypothetical protein
MAAENIFSTSLTNRDAVPRVLNTAGRGCGALVRSASDYLTVPASANVGSTFRIVQIPSNAVVLSVHIESEAQTAGKVDVGAYRTTSDGAAVVDADFFATAVDLASAVAVTDITNESTTYTLNKRIQPIWQALGMSTDPKCDLDIVATVVTTAVTTGTGKLGLRVTYEL